MAADLERFSGEEEFAVEPARLFAAVTDLQLLARSIPDLVSFEVADGRTLRCVVRPGFSFLRGTMRLAVTLAESSPPRSALLRMSASGIGVGVESEARLRIEPVRDGAASRLAWEARVTGRSGLVAAVSPALVRAAAERVLRDGWTALRKQVEG